MVGAGLPQLPGLAGDAKSYAERLFEFPQIGSLGEDDARAVLELSVEQHGVDFATDALDELLARTQAIRTSSKVGVSRLERGELVSDNSERCNACGA